jgi:hypothetical protein
MTARDEMQGWVPGDHWIIDDVTGFKVLASKARLQWDGALVDKKVYEPRHPQDLIRPRRERPGVINARPRPNDVFIGPLTTVVAAAAAAGSTTLVVESTVRMAVNDRLSIMLDNGDTFLTTIFGIVDLATLTLSSPLPCSTSVGMQVFDNTAMAQADVG